MEEREQPSHIVIGQQVSAEKRQCAERMRREMTLMENVLWQKLRRSQLGVNFRRQQIIDGFIVDFYCHRVALVVEVDGPAHEPAYDAERDRILSNRGLRVVRFTNEQVRTDIGRVLYQLRQHLNPRL